MIKLQGYDASMAGCLCPMALVILLLLLLLVGELARLWLLLPMPIAAFLSMYCCALLLNEDSFATLHRLNSLLSSHQYLHSCALS